jgi:hypothetical protein
MIQRERASAPDKDAWDGQLSNRRSELGVLIVDDNALNTRLLGAFLKKYGCRNIQKAENGAVAVEAVKKHPECFDIIFMGTFFFWLSYLSSIMSLSTSAGTAFLIRGTLHSLRHATRTSCGNPHLYTTRF